nr:MAG TPA: hypothetical protein [Caudoviricetes sp.]
MVPCCMNAGSSPRWDRFTWERGRTPTGACRSRLARCGTAVMTCGSLPPRPSPTATSPPRGASLTGPTVLAKLGSPIWLLSPIRSASLDTTQHPRIDGDIKPGSTPGRGTMPLKTRAQTNKPKG